MSELISQREARRLEKRVRQLEEIERRRREYWSTEWFGGTEIGAIHLDDNSPALVAVRVARRLGHYVIAVGEGPLLRLYSVRHGK